MQRPMDVHQLPQYFYELFEVAIELVAHQELSLLMMFVDFLPDFFLMAYPTKKGCFPNLGRKT